MYYPEDYYEISERLRAGDEKPMVHIDIKDIRALPYALRRLAEQGHDMTLSLEALQKACDEQRKRKALEAAISDLTKPAEK